MAAVHSSNTAPEMLVRGLVHGLGYRYRLHVKTLPGRPDLVFPSRRKVLFVHGCFWHRWDRKLLTSSMRTDHTAISQRRFADTKHGKVEPISRFHKLDPAGQCNTLHAGTGSDKGAFTSPRAIHPFSPRCITVRDAARLRSYPDWFRLHATKWHGSRQIGNSVPPLLGRAVASSLIAAMQIAPQKPTAILPLGSVPLLKMVPGAAARYYGVSDHVVGRRLRTSERTLTAPTLFAIA